MALDLRRRLPGRGAWLHPDSTCLDAALKRRAFHRAFRGPVETDSLTGLFHSGIPDGGAPSGGNAPAQKTDDESGSEI